MRRSILAAAAATALFAGVSGGYAQVIRGGMGDRPKSAAATGQAMLNRPIQEIKFDRVPLTDAMDFLRDSAGVNLHVNWKALEAAGVAKDTPVSLRLNNVSVRKALNMMLSGLGPTGAASPVSWYVDEGVIEVTTQDLADKHMITRVYTVEDLLMNIPDFVGPAFSLQQQAGAQGGGQSPFQSNTQQQPNLQPGQSLKTQRGQDLVKTITDTVRPDVWRVNGGTASIVYFNGMIIVTAPQQVQDQIAGR